MRILLLTFQNGGGRVEGLKHFLSFFASSQQKPQSCFGILHMELELNQLWMGMTKICKACCFSANRLVDKFEMTQKNLLNLRAPL